MMWHAIYIKDPEKTGKGFYAGDLVMITRLPLEDEGLAELGCGSVPFGPDLPDPAVVTWSPVSCGFTGRFSAPRTPPAEVRAVTEADQAPVVLKPAEPIVHYIERIVEVPVEIEKIVEVEKRVEVPVEVPIEKIVEVERIVHVPVYRMDEDEIEDPRQPSEAPRPWWKFWKREG